MNKRIIGLMVLVFIAAAGISAQDAYFPAKEGQVLLYANLNAKGKVQSYTQQTVKKVTGSGRNMTIEYVNQSFDAKNNPAGGEVPFSIKIVNGVIEFDLKSYAAPGTEGMVTITGDPIRIPASLNAGDKLPDNNYTMVLSLGFKITTDVKITNQEVVAVEEITVPAGTFTASKLTQTSIATSGKKSLTNRIDTWYAQGVGTVKQEIYNDKGKLQSQMVLQEIR